MTLLTRRAFGLTSLAVPATTMLPGLARASTVIEAPGASIYDANLGRYRITALLDGIAPLQRQYFSGDADAIDAVLEAVGAAPPILPAPINAFLLRSDDHTILVDAGMGELEMLGSGLGQTGDALFAAGVAPGDINTIIVTHAHPDHIGGLVRGNSAVFPNAEVIILDAEIGFWADDGIKAQAPEGMQGFFDLAGQVFNLYKDRIRVVASGTEVAPGITMDVSGGHTPGHSVLLIDGGDRALLMVADTLHNTELHTALPETLFGLDVDAEQAAQSRVRIFDRAASDSLLIAASHVHFPGLGRILRDGEAFRFVPASWI